MFESAISLLQPYVALIGFVAGIISTTIAAFVTPLGGQFANRRFSRKPVFSVMPPVLPPSLQAQVNGLNKLTKSGNKLYGIIDGVHVGLLSTRTNHFENWTIDLSAPHLRRSFLGQGQTKLRFFVNPDIISEEIGIFSSVGTNSEKYNIKYVDSGHDFISSLSSNVWVHLVPHLVVIDECFPVIGRDARWIRVFDGFELCISQSKSIRIQSNNSTIASSSTYGWVLVFEDCENIIIEDTTFGHTKSGACQGGVLKFKNCKNIHIIGCDLFGCGTYGIELNQSRDIKFTRCQVRDCTYGIVQIISSQNVDFKNCNFFNNKEFDLINVSSGSDEIAFNECNFRNNTSSGVFFNIIDVNDYAVRLVGCKFENNIYRNISNNDKLPLRYGD